MPPKDLEKVISSLGYLDTNISKKGFKSWFDVAFSNWLDQPVFNRLTCITQYHQKFFFEKTYYE